MKIYFAGPLFSEAERDWIRAVIDRIHALTAELNLPVKIIWPFELLIEEQIRAPGQRTKHEVFKRCRGHLGSDDMMIALLDGALVDDGTAWEIGYYYAVRPKGAKIIGIRTDQRRSGEFADSLVNWMVECPCDRSARPVNESMEILGKVLKGNGG